MMFNLYFAYMLSPPNFLTDFPASYIENFFFYSVSTAQTNESLEDIVQGLNNLHLCDAGNGEFSQIQIVQFQVMHCK